MQHGITKIDVLKSFAINYLVGITDSMVFPLEGPDARFNARTVTMIATAGVRSQGASARIGARDAS